MSTKRITCPFCLAQVWETHMRKHWALKCKKHKRRKPDPIVANPDCYSCQRLNQDFDTVLEQRNEALYRVKELEEEQKKTLEANQGLQIRNTELEVNRFCMEEHALIYMSLQNAFLGRTVYEGDGPRLVADLVACVQFIADQFCTQDDGRGMECTQSGNCLTEYCYPCYAKAVLGRF